MHFEMDIGLQYSCGGFKEDQTPQTDSTVYWLSIRLDIGRSWVLMPKAESHQRI